MDKLPERIHNDESDIYGMYAWSKHCIGLWKKIRRLEKYLAMSKRIQCLECGFSAPLYANSDEPNPMVEHRKICTYHKNNKGNL